MVSKSNLKITPKACFHSSKLHQKQTFPLIYGPVHISKLRFRCQNNYPSLLLKFILQNALSLPNMCLLSRSMQPKLLMFAFYFIVEYVLLRIVTFKFSFVWNVLELRARTSCNILRKSKIYN